MLHHASRQMFSSCLFGAWTVGMVVLALHQGPVTLFWKEFQMNPARFRDQEGLGYRYRPSAREETAFAQPDRLVVLENSTPLPEKAGSIDEVKRAGKGLYTVTARNIWLSSTDGSDPREGRKRYAMAGPRSVPRWLNGLALTGWLCLAGHRWFGAARRLVSSLGGCARRHPWAWLVVFLIIALRAVCISHDEIVADHADARDYVALAQQWYYHAHPIWFTRLPVYPLFVALIQPLGIPLRWTIELVQLACYALFAGGIHRHGVSLRASVAVFGSMVLAPQTADLNNYCLADTLYSPLLIGAAGAAVIALATMNWRAFAGCGILLGLLGDLREERILLVPLALLVIGFAVLVGHGRLRERLVMPALSLLLPWVGISVIFQAAFCSRTGLPGHCLLSTPGITALMHSLHRLPHSGEPRPMFIIDAEIRRAAYEASPTFRERKLAFENAPWKDRVKSFTGVSDFSTDGIVWTAMDAFKVDGPFSVRRRDDLMQAAAREIDEATAARGSQRILLGGTFPINETAIEVLRNTWGELIRLAFRQAFVAPQLGKFQAYAAADPEISAVYDQMANRRAGMAARMDRNHESRPAWIKAILAWLYRCQMAALWLATVGLVLALVAVVRSRLSRRDGMVDDSLGVGGGLARLVPLLFAGYLGASRLAFGILIGVYFYPASRYFLPISLVSLPVLLIAVDFLVSSRKKRSERADPTLHDRSNNGSAIA